jgi:uncharacterized protein (TIGR00251 family)
MSDPANPVIVRSSVRGVRIRLRVRPGGRGDRLRGAHAGALKVELGAAPERGRANAALIRLLAELLGVVRSEVAIVSGATSRDKLVEIQGVDVNHVAARLRAAGIVELKIEN